MGTTMCFLRCFVISRSEGYGVCVPMCVCVSVCLVSSYKRALKNDNNGKEKKKDESSPIPFGVYGEKSEKCRPAMCGAHTPSGKFTSRDSRGVAHHRLSMDEQSVIRYSLQVAFEQSYIFPPIFLPYSFLPRPPPLCSTQTSLNCLLRAILLSEGTLKQQS